MYDTILQNIGVVTDTTSSPSSVLISNVPRKAVPCLDLNTISISGYSNDEDVEALENLSSRVASLLNSISVASERSETAVVKCCITSLTTRMPHMIAQTKELLEASELRNAEAHMTRRIRSQYAGLRILQFFSNIEAAIQEDVNGTVSLQLDDLSSVIKKQSSLRDFQPSFCVSPWVSTALAFTMSLGKPAILTLKSEGSDRLPLELKVEPCVEFIANDQQSLSAAKDAAILCDVSVESCSHRIREMHSTSGVIGEVTLRARISPRDKITCSKRRVWGGDSHVPSLCIREARATQQNAFPPKPTTNVDLYTSYEYGDASVCVTLFLQTYLTKTGEAPDLRIELLLAPPRLV